MTVVDAYTLDTDTLKGKSVSELCDIIEQLIVIIRDQAQTIQLEDGIISCLKDDGK